jgi:hypothetical protein
MPFKLNDPGIAIQHIGTSFTESDSTKVDVLRLTFDKVGVTPSNMYDLYIDPESNLLVEWSYYRTQNDSVPRLRGPWHKYEPHNGVLFSSDRGGRKIDEISTYEKLPESIYNDLSMTGAEILAKEK